MSEDDVKRLAQRVSPGLGLILTEEFAREAGRELAKRMPKPKTVKTRAISYPSLPVNGIYEVFRDDGEGCLVDLQIIASSTSWILILEWDDQRFDKTYTEISNLAGYFGVITASQDPDTSSYVVKVAGINFLSGLRILVRTSQNVTFTIIGTVDIKV